MSALTKTYLGQRPADDTLGDCRVTVLSGDGHERPLTHVVHHSPTGFEWGYAGSGPADLALSILDDHFAGHAKVVPCFQGKCSARAWQLHQAFKFQMLAELPYWRWVLTSEQIDAWLRLQPMEQVR